MPTFEELRARDEALPANAFTLPYQGSVEEGIFIELCHPVASGTPALVLNDSEGRLFYVARHTHKGCVYRRRGDRGLVRRLSLGTYNAKNSGREFQLLESPTSNATELYLHVSFMVPQGMTLRLFRPLYSGVGGSATITHQTVGEALVCFANDGDELLVCYPDGMIFCVVREGATLRAEPLSHAEIAEQRVAIADALLDDALGIKDHGRRSWKVKDIFHGLITLLELSAKMPKENRRPIVDYFADRFATLDEGVTRRLSGVLNRIGDREAWYMITAPASATNVVQMPVAKARKVGDRKAERRERDREQRSRMRGSSSGKK